MPLVFKRYCTRFIKRPHNGFKREGDEEKLEEEIEEGETKQDPSKPAESINSSFQYL